MVGVLGQISNSIYYIWIVSGQQKYINKVVRIHQNCIKQQLSKIWKYEQE